MGVLIEEPPQITIKNHKFWDPVGRSGKMRCFSAIIGALVFAAVSNAEGTMGLDELTQCRLNLTVNGEPSGSTVDLGRLETQSMTPVSVSSTVLSVSLSPCSQASRPSGPCSSSFVVQSLGPTSYVWAWDDSTCFDYGSFRALRQVRWWSNPPAIVETYVANGDGEDCPDSRSTTVIWQCDELLPTSQGPVCLAVASGEGSALCGLTITCRSSLVCPTQCSATGGTVCSGVGEVCYTDVDEGKSGCVDAADAVCVPEWTELDKDFDDGTVDGTAWASGSIAMPGDAGWGRVRSGASTSHGELVFGVNVSSSAMMIGVAPTGANRVACDNATSNTFVMDGRDGSRWIQGVKATASDDDDDFVEITGPVWSENDLVVVRANAQTGLLRVSVIQTGNILPETAALLSLNPVAEYTITKDLPTDGHALFPVLCFPPDASGSDAVMLRGVQERVDCVPRPPDPPLPSPAPFPHGNFCWADVTSSVAFDPSYTYPSRSCTASNLKAGTTSSCSAQVGYGIGRGMLRWAIKVGGSSNAVGVATLPIQSYQSRCFSGDAPGTYSLSSTGEVIERASSITKPSVTSRADDREYGPNDVVVLELDMLELSLFMWVFPDQEGTMEAGIRAGNSLGDYNVTRDKAILVSDTLLPDKVYYPSICSIIPSEIEILRVEETFPYCAPWPSTSPKPTPTASSTPSITPSPVATPSPTATPSVSPTLTPSPSVSPSPSVGHLDDGSKDKNDEAQADLSLQEIGIIAGVAAGSIILVVCIIPFAVYKCTKSANASKKQKELMSTTEDDSLVGGFGGLTSSSLTAEIETTNPMREAEERARREQEEKKKAKEAKLAKMRKFRKKVAGEDED